MDFQHLLLELREDIEHLVFAPRFGNDELNYAVLGSVNERAKAALDRIDAALKELESPI